MSTRAQFQFLHCADIHLDSPLRGLDRYEGAPARRIRLAARRAFERLIDDALDLGVAFVVISGDLYDGDWRDYSTGLFFAKQMGRLSAADIPVVIIYGNHDAHSEITATLKLPPGVHALPSAHAGTVKLEEIGVSIHGRSYGRRAETDDLARTYPSPTDGHFNIGLLHTCLDGREGHAPYAPCQLTTLAGWGYDYWALGHVHTYEILHRDPWVVFPGNLQGRHIKEVGPKGAVVVTVEGGRVTEVNHRAYDVLRWHHCEVDVTGVRTPEAVVEQVELELSRAVEADDRLHAARVTITGATRAHQTLMTDPEHIIHEIRAMALGRFGERIWLEKIKIKTRLMLDAQEALARDDALGALLRAVAEGAGDAEVLETARADLWRLQQRVNADLGGASSRVDLMQVERVSEARQALVARLLQLGEPVSPGEG